MSESNQCCVCRNSRGTHDLVPGTHSTMRFVCATCGTYDIDYGFMTAARGDEVLTADMRLRQSHAIRKATDGHGSFAEGVLDSPTSTRLADQHPLPEPVEQADVWIDSIARRCVYYDVFTKEESPEVWAARIGLKGAKQLITLQQDLASLVKQSGLTAAGVAVPGSQVPVRFSLTLNGWARAREIRQERGPGNQAFVAMWFHPDMDAAFDDGFDPALRITGHTSYRVDRDAHNNKVDDQIVAEIRRSKLVIVDATGARPNADFEAGFAMGLGVPVLWCCNESWEAHLHTVVPRGPAASGPTVTRWSEALAFDTRQHLFVMWSDPADLREKLTNRIRALGFDAAWNRAQ